MKHQFTDAENTTIMNAVNAVVKLLQKHQEPTVRLSLINIVGCAEKEADMLIKLAKDYMATCHIEAVV
jgi:hypothetical protein